MYGERLIFRGWSPDDRYVAYTLDRVKRPRGKAGADRVRVRHLSRRVYRGHLASLGPVQGKRLLRLVRRAAYQTHRLATTQLSKNVWRVETPGGPATVRFEAKKEVTWSLSSSEGVLALGKFPKPYVRFEPQAFLSPSGEQILLVMHVNTGWYQDVFLEAARLKVKPTR